jgi:DNA repair ATPase RecN
VKLIHAQIAECQCQLDQARRELKTIVENIEVDDQELIEARERMRKIFQELKNLDTLMLGMAK